MDYRAVWHSEALHDLKQLDKTRQKAIIEKVKTYLVKDPLNVGKPLTGQFKGLYRIRFEDYRIIYSVDREDMKVIVIRIGHRKEVYK